MCHKNLIIFSKIHSFGRNSKPLNKLGLGQYGSNVPTSLGKIEPLNFKTCQRVTKMRFCSLGSFK